MVTTRYLATGPLFFPVVVTSRGVPRIVDLFDSGQFAPNVGVVLPLAEARRAQELLAGKPRKRGKIALVVGA